MSPSNQERAAQCNRALAAYSDYDSSTNLIDFLADAMHWCHVNGEDFHYALAVASRHHAIELNNEITNERTKP